jgi:hypothetical protein
MTTRDDLELALETIGRGPRFWDEVKEEVVDLTADFKADEMFNAVELMNADVHQALMHITDILDKHSSDLDKMRNHRHDISKQFGGRPEF